MEQALDLSLSNKKIAKSVSEKEYPEPINGIVQPPVDLPPQSTRRWTNQLQFLKKNVFEQIWKHKYVGPFKEPVNIIKLKLPFYYQVITDPMDFGTIKKRLTNRYYWSAEECIQDFEKVFKNCYVYNNPDQDIVTMAQTLEKLFNKKKERMPKSEVEIKFAKRRLTTKDVITEDVSDQTVPSFFKLPNNIISTEHEDQRMENISLPSKSLGSPTAETEDDKPVEGTSEPEIEDIPALSLKSPSSSPVKFAEAEAESVEETFEAEIYSLLECPSSAESEENGLEPMEIETCLNFLNEARAEARDQPMEISRPLPNLIPQDPKSWEIIDLEDESDVIEISELSTVSSFFKDLRTSKANPLIDVKQIIGNPAKDKESSGAKQQKLRSLQYCEEILEILCSEEHTEYAWPFYFPFNFERWQFEGYHKIIKKPMDLQTIKQKIERKQYKDSAEFAADVRLIFTNCYKYNSRKFDIISKAQKLQIVFEKLAAEIPDDDDDSSDDSESSYNSL